MLSLLARCFVLLMALLAAGAHGASAENLLEPEKAFRMSSRALDERTLEVRYAIADGYYMYRERFKFAVQGNAFKLGAPEFPPGERKTDEFFGEVETYRKQLAIRLPFEQLDAGAQRLQLSVTSQGCADIGVCYAPIETKASIALAGLVDQAPPSPSEGPRSIPAAPRVSGGASDFDIAALFESGSYWLVLASFVGFGLLLSLTPCMLPMVPILSGIIAGEGRYLSKPRALILSSAYVLGMALTYAIAGVAAAYSGSLIAAALQNPWVLSAFALVFVWLALSMFGLHDLRLPAFLHHRLSARHHELQGGRIASVAVMGVFSAVIVSPCVAAPLAGALLYISQTRDVVLGGSALFAMALGMGAPLIVVGVSEGALLPKSGPWMLSVKKFFGVLLLAVAVWIVTPVIPVMAQMLAWAALLIGSGVFLRAIDPLPAAAPAGARLGKALGLMALLAGAALLIGALAGSKDPLRPLGGLRGEGATPAAARTRFLPVASLDDLGEKLRAPGKPVMLDFYADWCVTCKEMESFTFSDARVKAKFEGMLLLQADVTANTAQHQALLKRFSLFGPPGIIFFDANGTEIRGLRVIGYQDAQGFLATLERVGGG